MPIDYHAVKVDDDEWVVIEQIITEKTHYESKLLVSLKEWQAKAITVILRTQER